MSAPGEPTAGDLLDLELAVCDALDRRDVSGLNVIGFGELSVALGWPHRGPRFVCKRTPPATSAQLEAYGRLVESYLSELGAVGVATAPTTMRVVDHRGRRVGYLVQPLYPKGALASDVLASTEPSTEHPVLSAVADALTTVGPRLSIDAQFTNWASTPDGLTLLDVGTPLVWDADGRMTLDMQPFMALLPLPFRRAAERDVRRLAARWRTPRGAAVDVAANLYRLDLEQWVEPTIAALNAALDPPSPITALEARAAYDEDQRTWPRLKRMQLLQRAWQTKVRRRPYEFFIQDSFTGTIH